MSHDQNAREMLNRVRFAAAQAAWDNAAPPDDEDEEIAARRTAIECARLALDAAEKHLDEGNACLADQKMADAMGWLEPA